MKQQNNQPVTCITHMHRCAHKHSHTQKKKHFHAFKHYQDETKEGHESSGL